MQKVDVFHVGVSILAPLDSYGPVSTPCWTLGWMIEGSAVARVNGEPLTLDAGVGLLTQPGDEVVYRWGPEELVRHGFVIFSTPEAMPHWRRRVEMPGDHLVAHLLDHILWLEAERPAGWWSSVGPAFESALRAIVSGYVTAATAAVDEHSLPAPIVDSLRFVARQWGRGQTLAGIKLDELARAAGVSPEHLCRVYAHTLGVGPVTAVRLIRLKRAATLLAQTNLSVAEVSRRIGFGSEFHFSRTFKSASGLSPSAFRADPTRAFELPPEVRRLHNYLNASRPAR